MHPGASRLRKNGVIIYPAAKQISARTRTMRQSVRQTSQPENLREHHDYSFSQTVKHNSHLFARRRRVLCTGAAATAKQRTGRLAAISWTTIESRQHAGATRRSLVQD